MEERVAIAVDLLDLHRRDDLTQLTENDVLCLPFDLLVGEIQEADRRVLTHVGLRADRDREDARHRDADVLERERVLERDVDLDRLEAEIRVLLNHRPDEGAAAGDALRALTAADLSRD